MSSGYTFRIEKSGVLLNQDGMTDVFDALPFADLKTFAEFNLSVNFDKGTAYGVFGGSAAFAKACDFEKFAKLDEIVC